MAPATQGAVWFALDMVIAYQRADRKVDAEIARDIFAVLAVVCDRSEATRRRNAAIVRVWRLMGESTTPARVARVLDNFERDKWPHCKYSGLPADRTDLDRALHDAFRFAAVTPNINGKINLPRSAKQISRILGHPDI